MSNQTRGFAVFCIIVSATAAVPSFANVILAANQQPAQPIAQAPAQDQPPLQVTVLEAVGEVKKAALGADATTDANWTAVKVDDQLAGGTQLKTGLRSHATLKFGDDTVVQVRKGSFVSIDESLKGSTENTVKLTLGYGTIRGGSVEGEVRTDVVVDSTVATLAKRGTEGWQMTVEPSTADFSISLSRSGLVEALSRLSGRTKTVRPGEYANRNNIFTLWINQAVFDRAFNFYSTESQSDTESSFGSQHTTGNGILSPGAGTDAGAIGNSNNADFVNSVIGQQGPGQAPPPPPRINRPEGDFGVPDTFQGLLTPAPRRSPTSGLSVRIKR